MQAEFYENPQAPYSLPKEIEVYETELTEARNNIQNIIRVADGLLFGVVGINY